MKIAFGIKHDDTRKVKLLKLTYLIPAVLLSYPIYVIVAGMKEAGNPFMAIWEVINENHK